MKNHSNLSRCSSRRGRTSLVVLGVLALGLVVVYSARFFFAGPSSASLRDQALHGSNTQVQREAARRLADMGVEGVEELRFVARQSVNEEVVAVCLVGLARQYDDECMDLFLEKLDDPSIAVRVAASKASTKILGRDHHFPADGSAAERQRIKENMEKDWKAYNGSELYHFNKERLKKEKLNDETN